MKQRRGLIEDGIQLLASDQIEILFSILNFRQWQKYTFELVISNNFWFNA
jgi:hypothetical protein